MQTPKQPSFSTLFFLTLFLISLYIPFSTSAKCNYDDKMTLITLKSILGKNDKFLNNWLYQYDCCYWNGVGCDEDGRVISLSLRLEPDRSSPRQFTIPSEIQYLSELKYLNLSVNGGYFTGSIDRGLAQLYELEVLDLSGNQLEGTIPGFLGDSLENLKYIDLSRNKLSGQITNTLGSLRILFTLNLASNQLTGPVPKNLGGDKPGSRPLETLNLANNKLSGPIPVEFGRLRRLKKLYLENNQLNGTIPDQLGSAPLKKLDLSGNQLCGGIPYTLQSFSAQSFRYNKCLCGKPLNNVCPAAPKLSLDQVISTLVE